MYIRYQYKLIDTYICTNKNVITNILIIIYDI